MTLLVRVVVRESVFSAAAAHATARLADAKRGDLLLANREQIIDLYGAAGKRSRQPDTQPGTRPVRCRTYRLEDVSILSMRLFVPCFDRLEPLIGPSPPM